MYREAIKSLYQWKKNKYRKPLVIEGARQVGKNLEKRLIRIPSTLTLILTPEWRRYLQMI